VVVCRKGAIRFDPDLPLRLDVERFESTISAAVNHPDPLPADVATDLQDGVRLYRGELMEGFYDEWVLAERARLSELYLAALYRLVAFHRARGDTAAVARYGDQALRCEPLREDVHRELMAAYAEAGQSQRAIEQFERCRRLLATDLGIDPMPETLALVARIRRGTPIGDPTHPTPVDLCQLTHELLAAQRQLADLAELIARSLATLTTETTTTASSSSHPAVVEVTGRRGRSGPLQPRPARPR
jgi:DNA-binding SARP family transcriptional activator